MNPRFIPMSSEKASIVTNPMPGPSDALPGTYRTIRLDTDLRFDILIPPEDAENPDNAIVQSLAQGAYPEDDRPLLDLVSHLVRPGGTVLDLGAHLGVISLALAASGYHVVAVEASPRNAAALQASAARNQFTNLRVIHAAVSDRPGTIEFLPYGPFGMVATPELAQAIGVPAVQVPAITIDDLFAGQSLTRVDFIKMDIEGSEVAALRGMANLLSGPAAPPVLYESNGYTLLRQGQTIRQLRTAVEAFGYRNYLVGSGELIPVQAEDAQPQCVVDYLAVEQPPDNLPGWRVRQPLSREETISAFLHTCDSVDKDWAYREHVVSEVQNAPAWLLSDPTVRQVLQTLKIGVSPSPQAATRKERLTGWLRRLWSNR